MEVAMSSLDAIPQGKENAQQGNAVGTATHRYQIPAILVKQTMAPNVTLYALYNAHKKRSTLHRAQDL
jgi:hypothetical protein